MTHVELCRAADELLRRIPRNPDAPHYTDDSFRCKLATAAKRNRRIPWAAPPTPAFELVQSEWRVVFRLAKLTCRQKEVVQLRLRGKTMEEIGAMSGCTKQAVMNVLRQAQRRIYAAQSDYAYDGLAEVYRAETERGRRTHHTGRLVR